VHTRAGSEATLRLSAQCGAQFTASALHPVIELLRSLLREALPEGISPHSLHRLEPWLHALGLSAEHLQALGTLLSLPSPESRPTLQLTPEHQKVLVFDALATLLQGLARARPVLAVVEDLHWADPSTLELLVWLLEPVTQSRVLLLLSTRPELRYAPLREHGVHALALERLPPEQTETLVWETARGRALAPERVRQLVERTEGVPLFVEEITRMVLERQAAGDLSAAIPLSLNELLLARLDMLPPRQKTLAQLCAVVGRRFSLTLLAALTRQPEPAMLRELEGLAAAGILRREEQGAGPVEYQFRHALIQEAAWQSLLRGSRREYHQRIAEVVVERFPEMAESHPELLAHHYTEAGLSARAVSWWARAGQQASLRSANQEAIGHLKQALRLLRGLPDASQRKGEELQFLLLLGLPLVQVQGYRSTEAEQAYARTRVLFREVGEELPRLELSYWGPISFYVARSELHLAQELAEQLVTLGQRHQSREMLVMGYRTLSFMALTYGRQRAARAYVERALECSDFTLEEHKLLSRRHMVAPRVAALSYGSIILSLMDEREKARCWRQEALELAGRIGHPHDSALALNYAAISSQFQGDAASTLELAERCVALSREHHFRLWLGWSTLLRSWAMAGLGRAQEGLILMKQGIEAWQSSGIQAGKDHHNLGMLAEIHWWCGQPQQALDLLEGTLAHLGAERFYEPELHRLRGECLRVLGREQEAVASLLRAMEVARQQDAFIFERRARQKLGSFLRAPFPTAPEATV
jgi:tetratricopeptide (TPR) repeat protein